MHTHCWCEAEPGYILKEAKLREMILSGQESGERGDKSLKKRIQMITEGQDQ
jgi:hypothetical protein